jgi:hypothetical protein
MGVDDVHKEIDELRDEVKTLRAELTATRAIISGDVDHQYQGKKCRVMMSGEKSFARS